MFVWPNCYFQASWFMRWWNANILMPASLLLICSRRHIDWPGDRICADARGPCAHLPHPPVGRFLSIQALLIIIPIVSVDVAMQALGHGDDLGMGVVSYFCMCNRGLWTCLVMAWFCHYVSVLLFTYVYVFQYFTDMWCLPCALMCIVG
jgi:hypothetical protein